MNLQRVIILIGIFLLAIFFRTFHWQYLQYWSVDDEIFAAVMRRMIYDHTLTLVSPNGTLGVSLGSFFHLLSIPIFMISRFDPHVILFFGSLIGALTTIVLYLAGKEISGIRTGFLAAFLYSISFLVGLNDRRWWPLTLDPLLISLAILSVLKIYKKNFFYFFPLAVSVSFAWHSDPSLGVLFLFIPLSFWFLKVSFKSKYLLLSLIYLVISVSPLLVFELRHQGSISSSLQQAVERRKENVVTAGPFPLGTSLNIVFEHLTRAFFLSPGGTIEENIHCEVCPKPQFYPYSYLAVLILFFLPLILSLRQKDKKIAVLYIYLSCFFAGIFLYKFLFKSTIYQTYSLVVWPVAFLLVAISCDFLIKKRWGLVTAVFLAVVFFANLQSLTKSTMRYPLKTKMAAAGLVMSKIGPSPFSLKVIEDGRYLEGIAGLFYLQNRFPVNQSYYAPWDWYYRAYSLYGTELVKEDIKPEVIISPKSFPVNSEKFSAETYLVDDIKVTILR